MIAEEKFSEPTPIQCQTWPVCLAGRNLVAIAETGSGKTLGYLLPGLVHAQHQPYVSTEIGPTVLIITPTRELAIQVYSICSKYQSCCRVSSVCVYGGVSKRAQIKQMEKGAEICVGTPGRLLDFLEHKQMSLRRCTYVVLDEADRMLDMGMGISINKILEQTRPDRQLLMWTATWPKEIQSLAEQYLKDYIQISIGETDISANHKILQIIDVCKEADKSAKLIQLLLEILSNDETSKILIFADTKRRVEQLTGYLRRENWPAMCIHGDKEQMEREWVMQDFRAGISPILVATDVASRGLDIEGVKFVVNFDFPNSVEDYVHRIGRTARANSTGTAYTFFTEEHAKLSIALISVLKEAKQSVGTKLLKIADDYSIQRYGRRFNPGELPPTPPLQTVISTGVTTTPTITADITSEATTNATIKAPISYISPVQANTPSSPGTTHSITATTTTAKLSRKKGTLPPLPTAPLPATEPKKPPPPPPLPPTPHVTSQQPTTSIPANTNAYYYYTTPHNSDVASHVAHYNTTTTTSSSSNNKNSSSSSSNSSSNSIYASQPYYYSTNSSSTNNNNNNNNSNNNSIDGSSSSMASTDYQYIQYYPIQQDSNTLSTSTEKGKS